MRRLVSLQGSLACMLHQLLRAPAGDETLDAAERVPGIRLPRDFRRPCRWHDEVFLFDGFRLLPLHDLVALWHGQRGREIDPGVSGSSFQPQDRRDGNHQARDDRDLDDRSETEA